MSDLISRQDALDAFKQHWHLIDIVSAIKALPSAQPERKKGKWDFIGFQMFRCTACKHVFSQDSLEGWRTYTYEPTFPKFCPNCGADMRGETDEDRR